MRLRESEEDGSDVLSVGLPYASFTHTFKYKNTVLLDYKQTLRQTVNFIEGGRG